ncbi:hypothetical protein ACOSQ3_025394 [Xanthoceras sorbifolium]
MYQRLAVYQHMMFSILKMLICIFYELLVLIILFSFFLLLNQEVEVDHQFYLFSVHFTLVFFLVKFGQFIYYNSFNVSLKMIQGFVMPPSNIGLLLEWVDNELIV